jgi:predicted kinase
MEIKDFMVLIGEQASGKSTIAKCVYYCKGLRDTFKEFFFDADKPEIVGNLFTIPDVLQKAQEKFENIFGSVFYMEQFTIRYY